MRKAWSSPPMQSTCGVMFLHPLLRTSGRRSLRARALCGAKNCSSARCSRLADSARIQAAELCLPCTSSNTVAYWALAYDGVYPLRGRALLSITARGRLGNRSSVRRTAFSRQGPLEFALDTRRSNRQTFVYRAVGPWTLAVSARNDASINAAWNPRLTRPKLSRPRLNTMMIACISLIGNSQFTQLSSSK